MVSAGASMQTFADEPGAPGFFQPPLNLRDMSRGGDTARSSSDLRDRVSARSTDSVGRMATPTGMR